MASSPIYGYQLFQQSSRTISNKIFEKLISEKHQALEPIEIEENLDLSLLNSTSPIINPYNQKEESFLFSSISERTEMNQLLESISTKDMIF
jgi:hypothetical protein